MTNQWMERVAELEKENKELKFLNADQKKEIDGLVWDIEQHLAALIKQNEDLKCCGNCKLYYKLSGCENKISIHYCPQWQSDQMTRGARK